VYLWDGNEITKILNGTPIDVAVSPNGCGVVVKIGAAGNVNLFNHTFQFIDLCSRGRGK
jgi:hypothetical protein